MCWLFGCVCAERTKRVPRHTQVTQNYYLLILFDSSTTAPTTTTTKMHSKQKKAEHCFVDSKPSYIRRFVSPFIHFQRIFEMSYFIAAYNRLDLHLVVMNLGMKCTRAFFFHSFSAVLQLQWHRVIRARMDYDNFPNGSTCRLCISK